MFYYYHNHLPYHYSCHHCYHHHLMLCAIGLYTGWPKKLHISILDVKLI